MGEGVLSGDIQDRLFVLSDNLGFLLSLTMLSVVMVTFFSGLLGGELADLRILFARLDDGENFVGDVSSSSGHVSRAMLSRLLAAIGQDSRSSNSSSGIIPFMICSRAS